jgi:hypothetical protein
VKNSDRQGRKDQTAVLAIGLIDKFTISVFDDKKQGGGDSL